VRGICSRNLNSMLLRADASLPPQVSSGIRFTILCSYQAMPPVRSSIGHYSPPIPPSPSPTSSMRTRTPCSPCRSILSVTSSVQAPRTSPRVSGPERGRWEDRRSTGGTSGKKKRWEQRWRLRWVANAGWDPWTRKAQELVCQDWLDYLVWRPRMRGGARLPAGRLRPMVRARRDSVDCQDWEDHRSSSKDRHHP
jgi:hypothetical protein